MREHPTEWARRMLASNAVILDSETTGLSGNDQMIQLAVIDMAGAVLMDTLLRPTCPISRGASAVHGLTVAHLADAPTIADKAQDVQALLTGRPVVIYNAEFDLRLLRQSLRAHALLDYAWVYRLDSHCAMKIYTAYCRTRRWVKLAGGDHSAIGDCRAVLALLREMGRIGRPQRSD